MSHGLCSTRALLMGPLHLVFLPWWSAACDKSDVTAIGASRRFGRLFASHFCNVTHCASAARLKTWAYDCVLKLKDSQSPQRGCCKLKLCKKRFCVATPIIQEKTCSLRFAVNGTELQSYHHNWALRLRLCGWKLQSVKIHRRRFPNWKIKPMWKL